MTQRAPHNKFLLLILTLLIAGDAIEGRAVADRPPTFYDPVEQVIEGWTVAIDPKLLADENQDQGQAALRALANHLQRIRYIVPENRLKQLQELRIWVDWEHALEHMQYHPDRGWLIEHGHDPRLVKHVHVPRARTLLDRRQWSQHPYVVLHELAHAFHDQLLGFDHPEIRETFDKMKDHGSYENVLRHTGRRGKHYALGDHKEYFAESTEAYFGVNDFYPFVRAELKEHDPRMFALMVKVWGRVD